MNTEQQKEKPSDMDMEDQMAIAIESGCNSGSIWPAMSYEDGVAAALRWVLGYTQDKPMED